MKYTDYTTQTKLKDMEILRKYGKEVVYNPEPIPYDLFEASFDDIHVGCPSWDPNSMLRGVKRLAELEERAVAAGEEGVLYRVYADDECDDSQKKDVVIFDFPADPDKSKKDAPFIIVCAGGGYNVVCSMVEAFPTAEYFNRLGYHCFCLNYRCGGTEVLPKPVEDVAKAYKFIEANKEKFGITNTDYVVSGFSAGGNLTVTWGLKNVGYEKYGVKRPVALFPIYPVCKVSEYLDSDDHEFLITMFGDKLNDRDYVLSYSFPEFVTKDYPPCYVVHCKDDTTVPYHNSVVIKEKLDELGIAVSLELGETGEHGFGDGGGTDCVDWPKRAIEFLEGMR